MLAIGSSDCRNVRRSDSVTATSMSASQSAGDIACSSSGRSGWLSDAATIACDPVVLTAATADLCAIRVRLRPGA